MPRRVLATTAVALIVPAACVAWGVADRIIPPLVRAIDAAWEKRALPF